MKLKSINVVETIDADTPIIHAFTADAKGHEQAKECFRAIAREQEFSLQERQFSAQQVNTALMDGRGLSTEDGSWSLQIIHSEWRGVPPGSKMAE